VARLLEFIPIRIQQIQVPRRVSSEPRDRTEDQRLDRILDSAEQVIQESVRDRSIVQSNRVNALPTTKTQLKKARKAERLQEARDKSEIERQERLRNIRTQVIEQLTRADSKK
jgi:hypothetical protein